MRTILRLRQLAVQRSWCQTQPVSKRYTSTNTLPTTETFFDFPSDQSPSTPPLHPRFDPFNETFWRHYSSPPAYPSPTPHDRETINLHILRDLLYQQPRPQTEAHCDRLWTTYSSLPLVTRRSLPYKVYKHLLTVIIPAPPDRAHLEAIRPPHIPRDTGKGKGKAKEVEVLSQARAKMMDTYRFDMHHRLRSVISDMASVDKQDLIKVLEGLQKTGNVDELDDVVEELMDRFDWADYKWLKRNIVFSKLDTVLLFVKSALREKRSTSVAHQQQVSKILWEELRGFTDEGGVDRKNLRKLTNCLYYACMLFEHTEHAERLDGILTVALEDVYGFDRRFLRVEREKYELWDAKVVAVLMGWLGRRGEGWRMVAAMEALVEAQWDDGLVVKEEKVEVDEFDWMGRRQTQYFEENRTEAPAPNLKEPVDVSANDLDARRTFNDFYVPLADPPRRDMLNRATLHIMVKHAVQLQDPNLGLHIVRMGLVYAKEEQARWLASVGSAEMEPPTLLLHEVPIRSLYAAGRAAIRHRGRPVHGWLFKEIHAMWGDVAERLESERVILSELDMHGSESFDLEQYTSHLTEQQAVVRDFLELSESTRTIFKGREAGRAVKRQEGRRVAGQNAVVGVAEPVMIGRRSSGWDRSIGMSSDGDYGMKLYLG